MLLMSAILIALLRWTLPFGSLTLLLAGNSTLMFLMTWRYSHEQWFILIAALIGGLMADALLVILKPSTTRVKALRWFSFLAPALFFLAYFLSLILTQGIWWNSNMWLGMIFFSGITGLGLSWLAVSLYSFETKLEEK
jgi:cell shape-determining protein MreD